MDTSRRQTALALLAASLAGAPFSSWAQTAAQDQAGPPPPAAIEPPDPDAGPDTSVDTQTGSNKHMMAPVMINGQGPFQFLLDTGANFSCISTSHAKE